MSAIRFGKWYVSLQRFIHHEEAKLIAKMHHLFCRRIMGDTERNDAHITHGKHLAMHRLFMERSAKAATVMMQAYTAKLDRLTINTQHTTDCEGDITEADKLRDELTDKHCP